MASIKSRTTHIQVSTTPIPESEANADIRKASAAESKKKTSGEHKKSASTALATKDSARPATPAAKPAPQAKPKEAVQPAPKQARSYRRLIGVVGGLAAAFAVYFAFPKEFSPELAAKLAESTKVVFAGEVDPATGKAAFDAAAQANQMAMTAAVAVLMGTMWMTEAIPLAITALIPLVAFPVLGVGKGIAGIGDVGASYGSSTIWLFMGGFFLALAMERWHLQRRIALVTVLLVGTKPKRLVLGFMVTTGFLSMWVSNTATAVMMLPIGASILALLGPSDGKSKRDSKFGTALMFGIAYSASLGSLSTLIGTPPNTLLKAYLLNDFGISMNFGLWMLFATPLAWGFMLIAWWLITTLYRPEVDDLPGGKELIREELAKMGPMSRQEKIVGVYFLLTALAWVLVPFIAPDSPFSDEVIAMVLGIALFLTPAESFSKDGLLDWKTAKDIPWDVLLLFGGGLALSAAFTATGLSTWIGDASQVLAGMPPLLLIMALTLITVGLTEVTSNTATAAAFLPIMGAVAVGMGLDPQALMIPVALGCTCAFMLPVATPPNAIAYSSGYIEVRQMMATGVKLHVVGITLITAFSAFIAPLVFGYSL